VARRRLPDGRAAAGGGRARHRGEGLDLSASRRGGTRARLHAIQSSADAFEPTRRYACITAFDLVEHLIDPNPFLARVRTWLAPGGRLAITVPTSRAARSRDAQALYYYAPPVHVTTSTATPSSAC